MFTSFGVVIVIEKILYLYCGRAARKEFEVQYKDYEKS